MSTSEIVVAAAPIIGSILLSAVFWKVSRIFVTRDEFKEFRDLQAQRHTENVNRLENIENNVLTILQRAPPRR